MASGWSGNRGRSWPVTCCLSQGRFSTAAWVVLSGTVGDSIYLIKRNILDLEYINTS